MLAKNWLRSLTTKIHGPRLTRAARRATGRLRLEALEDRVVPASRFWESDWRPIPGSLPDGIVSGPNNTLWFTEYGVGKIGRIDLSGPTPIIAEFSAGNIQHPAAITAGPRGHIWFSEAVTSPTSPSRIGEMDVNGYLVHHLENGQDKQDYELPPGYDVGALASSGQSVWFSQYWRTEIGRLNLSGGPHDYYHALTMFGVANIEFDPQGNLWYVGSQSQSHIGRMTQQGVTTFLGFFNSGVVRGLAFDPYGNAWTCAPGSNRIIRVNIPYASNSVFTIPSPNTGPYSIVAEPDQNGGPSGNFWFTEPGVSKIGRITSDGQFTEFATPTCNSGVHMLTVGPDGNIWFVEPDTNKIGRFFLPHGLPTPTFEFRDSSGTAVTSINEGQAFSAVATNGYDEDRFQWRVVTPDHRTLGSNGPTFNWPSSESGTYEVTLTITDVAGGVGTKTQTINVANLPPEVHLNLVTGGSIDAAFGTNGVATTTTSDYALEPTQLSDGRIVTRIADGFRRFLPNGSPDSSFGDNGQMSVSPTYSMVLGYAIQGDKIILASKIGPNIALQRFDDNGIDNSFGTAGNGSISFSSSIRATDFSRPLSDGYRAFRISVLADDKILMVGDTDTGLALIRRNADGTADTSFGQGGVQSQMTDYRSPVALVVQSNGKILVGDFNLAVLRFNSDGTVDSGFGAYVTGSPGSRTGVANQVTFPKWYQSALFGDYDGDDHYLTLLNVMADGRIVAATSFGLVRYTNEGQLDSSFGHDGVSTINGRVGYSDFIDSLGPRVMATQLDGKILLGGGGGRGTIYPSYDNVLIRFNSDGSLDTGFGSNQAGFVSHSSGGQTTGLFLQGGGHATMFVGNATAGEFHLLRFAWQSDPDHVVGGQEVTLWFAATDPSSVDRAEGFDFQVDWGDGSSLPPINRTAGNGTGLSCTHVYAAGANVRTRTIQVTATDKDSGSGDATLIITVAPQTLPASATELEGVLHGSLPTDTVTGLPSATFAVTTSADVYALVGLVVGLPAQTAPLAVVLNIGDVTLSLEPDLHPPAGVTLVINGNGETTTLVGHSPALTVSSGNVIVTGVRFTNATDAPTILVTGGHLTLRNDFVQESTGYNQVAIRVTGGFVDLGTANDPGGNTINVNGPGSFFLNATSTPMSVDGDYFSFNGGPYVVAPSSIQGLVWVDSNNNGEVDFGEEAIPGVTVTLTGMDDLGNVVHRVVQTDAYGIYAFIVVRPSNSAGYRIAESQPVGYLDGRDTLGTVNGVIRGSASVNDVFSGIVISQGGSVAENYNIGERNVGGGTGQTATIGFWQNKNGQNLIKALNGGATATQLGHWLAVTFSNMYASLHGVTNSGVAAFYKTLFARNGQTSPGGPAKTDAQIMATALAVYVTNQALAGNTAAAYGFQVTVNGVGTRTFNVGNRGAAFGVANNSFVSVMDLLLAVNARSHNGLLYDQNGDGQISSSEASLRTMANDLFSAINEAGGI